MINRKLKLLVAKLLVLLTIGLAVSLSSNPRVSADNSCITCPPPPSVCPLTCPPEAVCGWMRFCNFCWKPQCVL
jgi:hypothetical protein